MLQDLVEHMDSKDDLELLSIWTIHDEERFSSEAFEVVRQLLEKRGISVPEPGAEIPHGTSDQTTYSIRFIRRFHAKVKKANVVGEGTLALREGKLRFEGQQRQTLKAVILAGLSTILLSTASYFVFQQFETTVFGGGLGIVVFPLYRILLNKPAVAEADLTRTHAVYCHRGKAVKVWTEGWFCVELDDGSWVSFIVKDGSPRIFLRNSLQERFKDRQC